MHFLIQEFQVTQHSEILVVCSSSSSSSTTSMDFMYYLMNWPTFGCCLVVKSYCLRTVQRFQRWQLREELACHSGHCHHSSSVNQPVFLLTLRSVPARQTLWSGLLQWPAQAKENSVMKHTYMLCKFCHRHHHSASRLRGHVCRIRMENEQRKLTWKGAK